MSLPMPLRKSPKQMSGLFHPFHKVPMSVIMPDTDEKSINKVSESWLRVPAEELRTPREVGTTTGYCTAGCCYELNDCVPPKCLRSSLNPQCDGIWKWAFGR